MQESLEEAGRLIDRHLQDDRTSPDISEWFPPPTVSGTSQKEGILEWTDFPALLASPRVPLPAQLLEQCAHIQCSCRMGVFPELCRAWMTIGSDFYIWNCENGGEVTCYDDLSDTILAVGLVRPRRGVLHRDIHYLLVLATPVDIVILGLSVTHFPPEDFTGIVSPGIDLIPDPLYTLPTNNASLLTIGCTDHGRIFLSGKDGCLYEVAYQAATDWYTQRYSKINHSKSSFSFLDPPVLQFTCSEDGSIVLMAIDNSRNIPYTRSDPSVLQYASPEDDSIVQIAIDNSRNILYTRSDKGDLHVYDLGDDGHGMCRVASLSQNSIVSAATNIARTIESSDFKPIVQIAVLEKSDSVTYHLLAVTHAGVQLYFTTMPFNQPAAAARPSTLSLLHVQLPLRFTASSTVEKPSKVHKAIYSNGVLLMTASEKEDIDTLSCINHRPFQKPKMKSHVITRVIGHTWALSKIDKLTPLTSFLYTPVLIQRHLLPPKKFVLLSAQGSDVFYIPRPVEQLRRLLDDSAGGDGKKLDCFFKFQQLDQACATCLFLACSSAASAASHSKNWYFSKEAASESEMSVWAARAFFRYGGEAQLRIQSSMPTPSNLGPMFGSPEPIVSPMSNPSFLTSPERGVYPPSVSTPAYPHLWSTLPQSVPSLPQSVPSLPGIMESEIVFSAKHNAICIYISQIIGNIWDRSIVVEEIVMNEDQAVTTMDTSVESEPLESALQELEGLLRFLDANFPFAAGSLGNPRFHTPTNLQHRLVTPGGLDMRSSQQAQEELQRKYTEAQLAEEKSLQRIYQLVRKICQVISLWQLLWDHMFTSIVSQLTKELQEQLKSTSFKNLVIRDKELTGALITSLINSYIQDNKTVDNISSYLQEVCPLLYSADDAVCSKANELLQRYRHVQNKLEKETMLRESLKQYQKISQQVDLSSVCAQYKEVRFFEGVVFLCLAAALKKDPQELGLLFYKNGEPEEDTVGLQAFQQRINIYNCITDTLQELLDQSEAAPQPASVPKKPGPPVLPSDPNMLSNEEAGIHFEQMLKLTQRSSDELFNVALFRWYIQADLTDKMLKLNSLFLEPFLVRMAEDNQNKVYFMELLWRYYEKNQNVSSAARVVAKLADMDNPEISLNQRLVYTSRAISAAKRSTEMSPFAADYNFLLKLVKKMDVAWIQLEIQETLKQQYSHLSSTQDVVSQLDSQIMDITKLYDEFAIPFKLPEFKLALRHCARHSDPISVENLWQEIIEQELSIGKTMNAADRMRALSLKLTSLGKTYAGAPQYFPLEFLVRYLEQKVCSLNWDVGFVTYTMQNIGVPIPKLLDVYGRLVKARDPCCYEMKKPLHLLECIHILRSGHDNVPSYQRPRLSAISSCLVALQCMNPMHVLQKTIGFFKSLHAKLARY